MAVPSKTKSILYNLLYDYQRVYEYTWAQVKFRDNNRVDLKLRNEEYSDVTFEEAEDILRKRLQAKNRKKLGRGYLEDNSMSINAKRAYDNGLQPISKFTASDLKRNGFDYSVDFFKWIIKTWQIRPMEVHHTSAAKNWTEFYSEQTIRHIAETCNLELLYKMYRGKITKEQAKRERKIEYAKVRILDSMIGGTTGTSVVINAILCDGVIFYSQKLCFDQNDRRLEILARYDTRPSSDFENKNLRRLSDKLVLHKTDFYRRYIR